MPALRQEGKRVATYLPENLTKDLTMFAFIALLLILVLFGAGGFAVHLLWFVLIVALILWLLGFFVGGVESALSGGRRRWYGR